MAQTKQTYQLSKIKQLIDLNGDSTNFDLTFKVTCKDSTPFNLLVVDQTTLDNTPNLQYKEVVGTISGNIVADKNVYQNYFLILKSQSPCSVDVELTKKVLPKTPENKLNPPLNNKPSKGQLRRKPANPPKESINWVKIGLIVAVVVGGLFILWKLYKQKDADDGSGNDEKGPLTFPTFGTHLRFGSDRGSNRGSDRGSDRARSESRIKYGYKTKSSVRGSYSPVDSRSYRPPSMHFRTSKSSPTPVGSRLPTGGGDLLTRLRQGF